MTTIFYRTGWKPAFIHAPINGKWQSLRMEPVADKKHWAFLHLPDTPGEFVFTDGAGHWDNPADGIRNYTISKPGRYAVYRGKVIPIQRTPREVLLVTDLDGTLLENSDEGRGALSRFTEFWISKHLFNGSKLVFSTGRSLEEFLILFGSGYDILEPDLLVTAVGSDVYTLDAISETFVIHPEYYSYFDRTHWDSDLVARVVIENFPWLVVPGKQYTFPFKVWMTARVEDVQENLKQLKLFLKNKEGIKYFGIELKVRTIVSGCGGWRYIDFTPLEGGKSMGLKFAKNLFRFDSKRTVVAGDSGNDITMFKGDENGVITNNAQDDFLDWYHNKPRKNKYISTFKYADAVIEAVEKSSEDKFSLGSD
jgi:sucrose-6F-phosphate phosphohydrolase